MTVPRTSTNAIEIEIHLSMPQPWTHYFEVRMTISGLSGDGADLVMPVWTPGSYLVREYSRNLHGFSAADEAGRNLHWEKICKNHWRVDIRQASTVVVQYRIYAFEPSVRASFLDDSHGYLNGAGVYLYVEGYQNVPHRLLIEPYPLWERISTGLDPLPDAQHGFIAPDFDTLVDCPIEIGNQQIVEFQARGVPHFISIHGEGNHDAARLATDFRKIIETVAEMMGDIPYRHYTFLLQLVTEGRTGIEHANSMSIRTDRWTFRPEEIYRQFLELAAHEYFHVWNAKRIRPVELGPFDYTKENYTRLLWVSEGFTDYYAAQIMRRAGLVSADDYLKSVSKSIHDLTETPGRLVESVAEASFDAWIKFYRQDANSPNVTISYYLKGSLIALVLDLELRNRTCVRSLDDVMRLLHAEYFQGLNRGFTHEEFRDACEQVAGGPLQEIFEDYCCGTCEIDFARYLNHAGLRFHEPAGRGEVRPRSYLGISARTLEGRVRVVGVTSGSPAFHYGLNLDDEIIAVNGFRVNQETLAARMDDTPPGSEVEFLISRDGRLRSLRVALGETKEVGRNIEKVAIPTLRQKQIYESWLRTEWETPKTEG